MKQLDISAPVICKESIVIILEQSGIEHSAFYHTADGSYLSFRVLVNDDERQKLTDSLLSRCVDGISIVVTPVEAVITHNKDNATESIAGRQLATREELYNDIQSGTRLDLNFIFFVVASVVVVAVGLLENNMAVVIGAMVIAPLLGPNVALAFASVLGDRELLIESLKINAIGIGLTLLLSVVIGFIWPVPMLNSEIVARTDVGFDGILLALASGAAAALSLTSGAASALVGVMVAVALLPPAATLGLMLSAGELRFASGAALLLAANIVSLNLAASLVFLFKGIKPRTWLEKRRAKQSVTWALMFWSAALISLMAVIYIRQVAA